jgi:hypothetical protein
MFLVVEQGVWRDVEKVNVGVVRGFYESILEKNIYYNCREKKLTTNTHARRPGPAEILVWAG